MVDVITCSPDGGQAMSSLDKMFGWFPHTQREWIEFIIVALLLWLLMVVAISELELTSIS
jgi:nitrate reductase NapE component